MVGGGKAHGAAQLVAVHNHALHGEGPPEDGRRPLGLPVAQGRAHGGGGELVAAHALHGLRYAHAEAVAFAVAGEQLGAAGAVLAEADVEARGHVARAQPLRQHVAGEVLVAHGRELGVEGDAVQAVDAQRIQHLRLLVQRGEAEVGLVGAEPAAGVRLEGDDAERRPQPAGGAGGLGDHLAVAVCARRRSSPAPGRSP